MKRLRHFLKRWCTECEAVAAMEAAFVFPLLLTLLLGTFDIGNGILTNQKTIRASQVVADLVTRSRSVSMNDINEAVRAGELAYAPLTADGFGVDIVSIRFDNNANPQIVWRETRNMAANATVLTDVASLAEPNGGVMVITVEYLFEPLFGGFVVDEIPMQEVAFARGRKSAVVALE